MAKAWLGVKPAWLGRAGLGRAGVALGGLKWCRGGLGGGGGERRSNKRLLILQDDRHRRAGWSRVKGGLDRGEGRCGLVGLAGQRNC